MCSGPDSNKKHKKSTCQVQKDTNTLHHCFSHKRLQKLLLQRDELVCQTDNTRQISEQRRGRAWQKKHASAKITPKRSSHKLLQITAWLMYKRSFKLFRRFTVRFCSHLNCGMSSQWCCTCMSTTARTVNKQNKRSRSRRFRRNRWPVKDIRRGHNADQPTVQVNNELHLPRDRSCPRFIILARVNASARLTKWPMLCKMRLERQCCQNNGRITM